MIKLWWQKFYAVVILGVLSLGFFGVYLFLYLGTNVGEHKNLIFNQPDEMANYAFIQAWSVHNQIGIPEARTAIAQSQIHPRSMTVVAERLVPIAFPGFIAILSSIIRPLVWLFGEKSFNYWVIAVTPLVSALSSFVMFGLCRSLGLTKKTAVVAGALLLINPAWWYYASRPLQANILFVFFALTGLAVGLMPIKKTSLYFLIGLSFGSALLIRPNEWVWLVGLLGVLAWTQRNMWRKRDWLLLLSGLALLGIVFFLNQLIFYGAFLGSGYVRPQNTGLSGSVFDGPQGIVWWQAILLPFGFNVWSIIKTVYYYGVRLFLPWTVSTVIAMGFLISKRKELPRLLAYSGGVFILAVWLAIYYGSWRFTDNLAGQVSIGSSQVRYFLPVFVLLIPLIAQMLTSIAAWGKRFWLVSALIGVTLFVASFQAVFLKFEGLVMVKNTVHQYYDWQEKASAQTPADAVIVTKYADKYLFPGRAVVTTGESLEGREAIKNLLEQNYPVYYYDFATSAQHLGKALTLEKPIGAWENLELRKITLTK